MRRPSRRTTENVLDAAVIILAVIAVMFAVSRPAGAAPITRTDEFFSANVTTFSTDPVGRWADDVARYFPLDQVDTMLRIIGCESGGNPNAKNPTSTASGLTQMLAGWYDGRWWPHRFDPFDPDENLYHASLLAAANPGFTDWNASRACWAGTAGAYSGTVIRVDADIIAGGDGELTITTTAITVP